MSHKAGSETHHGTGYWGQKQKCHPLIGHLDQLPDWLRRADASGALDGQVGTTLSVLGFERRKGWEQLLAANIAENFFGAIHHGHLEVEIEGGTSITKATLAAILSDPKVRDRLADQKGEPDKLDYRRAYLRALSSNEKIVEHTENMNLGLCELHILVAEKLPKRVAFLRNGMMITDELDKLKRFGDCKEFAAVLVCQSDKGNALLRAMEPPKHDDFEPEHLLTEKEKNSAKLALKEIAKWVRDMLARHAKDPVSDVTNLDELAEYFGDPEGSDGKKGSEEDPQGKLNVRARPLRRGRPLATVSVETDTGDEEDGQTGTDENQTVTGTQEGGGGGGGGNSESEGKSGVTGGANTPAYIAAALGNVRAVPLSAKRRRVAFTTEAGCTLNIEFQDSGADSNRQLCVLSSTLGEVKEGKLRGVPAKAGERVAFEVEFDGDFMGTVRVLAHAV